MPSEPAAMRFGIALPTYPSGATIDGVVAVAQAAERLGFVSAWTTDHVIMLPDEAGPYRDIFEPLLTLAYLAALTERVALGISVIVVPQRNGIVLAKELATLDRLCNGRLIAGVGAGWNEAEFSMLGYADRFRHRGAHLDETIRVWRHLWTTPDQAFEGRFYNLPPVAFAPAPVQRHGPEIWVGGSSEAARRRAGRVGAAWHPVGTPATELAELAQAVREAALEADRDMPEIAPRLIMQLGSVPLYPASAGRAPTLQGEPDEMIENLREYERAGASEIVCHFGSPHGHVVVEQMERFAAEVMPAFAH
ncbi:MAG TPA: TIGR03619 family F420-dependent LLM class oxidoreductase [Thermomicrobiales bacterium]|nr:TIGR03619 family F420-dependent LLM class oxidoreductase [Thermomicrobiales bacterium]